MSDPAMLASGGTEFRTLVWRSVDMLPHYVYRVFREDGALLYVGKTHELCRRLSDHSRAEWRPYAASVRWELWVDHAAAAAREVDVIATEFPLHNTQTYGADIGMPMSPKRVAGERAFRGLGEVTEVSGPGPFVARRRSGPGPATLILQARLEEEGEPVTATGRRSNNTYEGESF